MDVFSRDTPDVDLSMTPLGRDTAGTINSKAAWERRIAAAPHTFSGAGEEVQVSPPTWRYCPGGFDNQWIGECVGKASKNAAATILRIPEGATFDPARPDDVRPLATIQLSGLYNYANARQAAYDDGVDGALGQEGAIVAYALVAMRKKGVVVFEDFPDTEQAQNAFRDDPISESVLAKGRPHVGIHGARITSRQQYMDFLAAGYPIVDGIDIGSEFLRTADDGEFGLGGRTVGGHSTETCQFDKKLDRLYKRNSWCLVGWGMRTDDPEFAVKGCNGRNNVGYCSLQQYLDYYLTDDKLASGETDAFVLNDIPGFAKPKIAFRSATELF